MLREATFKVELVVSPLQDTLVELGIDDATGAPNVPSCIRQIH